MRTLERLNVTERKQKGPVVAVSTVAFALSDAQESTGAGLWIPLVKRIREPFLHMWALPGGPTQWDQTLTQTAQESLFRATQTTPNYLEQLHAFGSVERSADTQRTVTIAYWAQFRIADFLAERRAVPENVQWFNVDNLPELAFDHAEIIDLAVNRLRARTKQSTVAHRFLDDEFTLAQLRQVHETILGTHLDPANFRRDTLATKTLEETGNVSTGGKHRPAKLYRFNQPEHM